jgi:hypothetical protein
MSARINVILAITASAAGTAGAFSTCSRESDVSRSPRHALGLSAASLSKTIPISAAQCTRLRQLRQVFRSWPNTDVYEVRAASEHAMTAVLAAQTAALSARDPVIVVNADSTLLTSMPFQVWIPCISASKRPIWCTGVHAKDVGSSWRVWWQASVGMHARTMPASSTAPVPVWRVLSSTAGVLTAELAAHGPLGAKETMMHVLGRLWDRDALCIDTSSQAASLWRDGPIIHGAAADGALTTAQAAAATFRQIRQHKTLSLAMWMSVAVLAVIALVIVATAGLRKRRSVPLKCSRRAHSSGGGGAGGFTRSAAVQRSRHRRMRRVQGTARVPSTGDHYASRGGTRGEYGMYTGHGLHPHVPMSSISHADAWPQSDHAAQQHSYHPSSLTPPQYPMPYPMTPCAPDPIPCPYPYPHPHVKPGPSPFPHPPPSPYPYPHPYQYSSLGTASMQPYMPPHTTANNSGLLCDSSGAYGSSVTHSHSMPSVTTSAFGPPHSQGVEYPSPAHYYHHSSQMPGNLAGIPATGPSPYSSMQAPTAPSQLYSSNVPMGFFPPPTALPPSLIYSNTSRTASDAPTTPATTASASARQLYTLSTGQDAGSASASDGAHIVSGSGEGPCTPR